MLFSAEVSRNLAPLLRLPVNYRNPEGMSLQPTLGTSHQLKEMLRLRRRSKGGLCLALTHPALGRRAVGIDCLPYALLLHEGKGMNNGEELPDVVCSVAGTKMKDHLSRSEVHATVLHAPWVTRTSSIHCPCVCGDSHRQWKHCIVTIIWRILHITYVLAPRCRAAAYHSSRSWLRWQPDRGGKPSAPLSQHS